MDKKEFADQMLDHVDSKYVEAPAKMGTRILRILFHRLLPVVLTLLLLFLLIFLVPLPFHKEYKCVKVCLRDPSFQQDITLRFDGTYHLNLFTDDSFSGTMTMAYQIDPAVGGQTTLSFSELVLRKDGTYIYYLKTADGSLQGFASDDPQAFKNKALDAGTEGFCIGRLDSKRFLKEFAFLTCDDMKFGRRENWNGRGFIWDEVCIVPDCTDYESARAYLQEMGVVPQD